MTRQDLIDSFADTLEISQRDLLGESTRKAANGTRVYEEDFRANVHGHFRATQSGCPFRGLYLMSCTSLQAAELFYKNSGKALWRIAVLNFANPVEPGGGVTRGAVAQEESLCRSSNLFPCLASRLALQRYYGPHQRGNSALASDRVIYSSEVTVFKTGDPLPVLMSREEWFPIVFNTSSAPYFPEPPSMTEAALIELYINNANNLYFSVLSESENHLNAVIPREQK